MIIITLHFNAVLMKLWESSFYHLSLLVKLTPNSILGALLYDLKRKMELMAQVIFRRLQMPACKSKVLSAKRTLLLMSFHILRVVIVSLSQCNVPSSHNPSTLFWMKTICRKLKCFTLEPKSSSNNCSVRLDSYIWACFHLGYEIFSGAFINYLAVNCEWILCYL